MRGSCLCGKVQYEVSGSAISFSFDHCSRCRKSAGSAFAEVICKLAEFRWITGPSLVRICEAPVRKSAARISSRLLARTPLLTMACMSQVWLTIDRHPERETQPGC
jgi:hypothetical protein